MSGEVEAPDPLHDDAYRDLFRADESASHAIETGRLFRTFRVEGPTEAIIALKPDQARRLRTMHRHEGIAEPEVIDLTQVEVNGPPTVKPPKVRPAKGRAPGLRPGAVYVIDIVLTVLVAFIEISLRGGIGWMTGVALIIASVYTASVVRLADWVVAVIAPPIAFFLAAATAGQMNLTDTGVINRVAQVFFTLGTSWFWIIGAIALAFLMVVVRRRRSP